MTDTSSPGAAEAARAHSDAGATPLLDRHMLYPPRPLTAAEADTVFQPRTLVDHAGRELLDLSTVTVDVSVLKPSLTALVRWMVTLLAAALVQRGLLSRGSADQLVPILAGFFLATGTLAWSIVQKGLAARRIRLAAAADPTKVVLR